MKSIHTSQARTITWLRLILALSAASTLLVLTTRGPVRDSMLPLLASQTTGRQIVHEFRATFEPFNKQLRSRGMMFTHSVGPLCSAAYYHYARITIACGTWQSVHVTDGTMSPMLDDLWPVILRSLPINTTKAPWRINRTQTNVDPAAFLTLSTVPRHTLSLLRDTGGVQCRVDFTADSVPGAHMALNEISESCHKDIKIFGGWDCTIRHCKQTE
jgi:hypothetical protein